MAGRATFIGTGEVVPGAKTPIRIPADKALHGRSRLISWHAARFADADDGGFVTGLKSRRLAADGVEQTLLPVSGSAPKIVTTTDGQKGVLNGYPTLGGTLIGGEANRGMIGTKATLPNLDMVPTPFILAMLFVQSAASSGTLWSTNDPTNPITAGYTAAGQLRVYNDRTGGDVLQGANGDNDGALTAGLWIYDGVNFTVKHNNTVKKSGALSLNKVYADLSLRYGATVVAGASGVFDGMDGYWEEACLFSGNSQGDIDAFHSMAKARHPGLALAA